MNGLVLTLVLAVSVTAVRMVPPTAQATQVRVVFSESDKKTIQDFFRSSRTGLPPGLAKRGGKLPPGLEKQLQRNGKLPPGLDKKLGKFPPDLESKLSRLPDGVRRGTVDGQAVLIDPVKQIVLDVVDLILK